MVPSKLSTHYGRVMAKIRIERGMRSLDQAKLMGVAAPAVSRVELGLVKATAIYIVNISKVLKLTALEKDLVWEALAKDREDDQLIVRLRTHIDRLPTALIAELNAAIIAAEKGA